MRLPELRSGFRMFVIPDQIGNPGLCLLCFLVLLCFSTGTRGATNETINAASSATADEKTLDAGPQLRDPFWPIGYLPPSKPGKALESDESVDSARDKKTAFQAAGLSGMLKIGGVIRSGGRFYATINGFTVQTGEVVSAVADGEVYKFVVEKIDFKKVQIKPLK